MKLLILIIAAFSGTALRAQHDMHNMPGMPVTKVTPKAAPKKAVQPVIYTCPMHPEIRSSKPGNCPKCGMKLVPVKTKPVPKTAVSKPSPKPAPAKPVAKKPQNMADMKGQDIGNMDIKPAEKKRVDQTAQPVTYTCPMHPEIHAAKPGNCPKCGMRLVKEKPKAPVNHDGMVMPNTPRPDTSEDGSENIDHSKMNMDHNMGNTDMGGIDMAKKNLGPIKYITTNIRPRTVRYDLYIRDTTVNFGNKPKRAIAVNGQIPMPTLTFTEGDTAEIYVHNEMNEETSLHWHGLFLPNRMDGVPNLTQMPIKPHTTYFYKFPIIQHGTHWYHSHSALQEQIGMYGAFIMNKRKEWDIPTLPVVISDWTDMKPKEVHRSLKNATDWFAIKKGSTQSYAEAIRGGHFKTKINNEWKRMSAMDVSDVYYENFLINGKNQIQYTSPLSFGEGSGVRFKAGDKVRLRIANAGASSYFWLSYAGGKITVVATDGNDVEPVEVDRLIVAVSETYDVVVTIPENMSYEFLVTPEDRTKSASLWLGEGMKMPAPKLPKLKYFAGMKMMNEMMDMNGNMIQMAGMQMSNQVMDMNTVMYPEITGAGNAADSMAPSLSERARPDSSGAGGEIKLPIPVKANAHAGHNMSGTAPSPLERAGGEVDITTLNYAMLRAPEKTTLPAGPLRVLKFNLTGNMNRYVWTLDNKTISESDRILIKKGENVRIIMFNNSMMRHPMHLHGHDFRLLNGQAENAPMKNIIDIMPMETDTIEFAANEAGGDWFFHCHILYHMMSGMGRVLRYDNNLPNPDIPNPKLAQRMLFKDDRKFHTMAEIGIESNGSEGEAMLANTRYKLNTMWHLGYHDRHGYESETMIGRYLGRNQWLFPYVGYDYHFKKDGGPKNIFKHEEKNLFGQKSNKTNRSTVVAGLAYTLPLLFVADMRVDDEGKLRFQLGRKDIPISSRLRWNLMLNTDKEYGTGFKYIMTKYFSLSAHYDSDMGIGAGITLTY